MSTNILSLTIFALTIVVASGASNASPHDSDDRPNIIIIFTDDQGYADVGVYGAEGFETPNLDRLAEEGMRFSSGH